MSVFSDPAVPTATRPHVVVRRKFDEAKKVDPLRTAALYFSIMATCQRRGVEPFAYLARVFLELPLLLQQSGGKLSAEQLLTLLP